MMHTFYAKRLGSFWRMTVAGIIALHVTCASAQQAPANSASISASAAERYPAGSITSVENADAALAAVAQERSQIEARFVAEEQACHPKFFVTSCVNEAKERRRQALSRLRKVELEANAFKRRERVAEREKAAVERQARDEADRQDRVREPRESNVTESAPQEHAESANARPGQRSDRVAEHDAKLKRIEEEERASAQERAENVADYERKVRAARERQKKVAQRKAEREEERRAKQASEPGAQ